MARLIELREKLNLTQEELSERSGISVRTIQRIEAGTAPKGYTLKALAKALNINENELLEEDVVPEDVTISRAKLINLSSLLFSIIPPANIVLPLILMYVKKDFGPLAKQILSVQILWTILSGIVFVLCSFLKEWYSLGEKFLLVAAMLLVLINVFIIIKNASYIDRNGKLYFSPGFSII